MKLFIVCCSRSITSVREASFSAIVYMYFCGFCSDEVSLPLDTWDGLHYFIVALSGPSINFLVCTGKFSYKSF